MKIYYTSKDIEELAAKGVTQLEVNSDVTLTDFARETASQLGIELVRGSTGTSAPAAPRSASPAPQSTAPSATVGGGAFSGKPKGCMHGNARPAGSRSAARPQNSGAVNNLVDLVGKMIEQGD